MVRGGQQQVRVVVPKARPVRRHVAGQVARAMLGPCRGGRALVRVARPPAEVVCLRKCHPRPGSSYTEPLNTLSSCS